MEIFTAKIDLNLLRTFLMVAQEQSFRAASERLHLSPSAVSAQIKQLESQIGAPLFKRTTRQVLLTAKGEQLFAGLRDTLAALETLLQKIKTEHATPEGWISLACVRFVSTKYLAPTIARYKKEYPRAEVRVQEVFGTEIFRYVRDNLADFGIGMSSGGESGFDFMPITEEPLAALVPRTVIAEDRESISLGELATLPLLLHNSMSWARRFLDAAFQIKGICVNPHLECAQTTTLITLAEQAHGAAVVPSSTIAGHRSEQTQVLSIVAPVLSMPVGMITVSGKTLSPWASRFAEILASVMTGTIRPEV
jgi:DNA-binding transcriptional LysR family regulator